METLTDMGVMTIGNDGQDIKTTNYFDTEQAKNGIIQASVNGGAIRLLIPDKQREMIPEMATGHEVILSRGQYSGKDAVEILFDDHTENPFAVTVGIDQFDLLPEPDDKWVFTAWTDAGKVWECDKCMVRCVETLPYLKPWG